MDHHPVVRRRPRNEPERGGGPVRQSVALRDLLIIADRPNLFMPVARRRGRVWLWRATGRGASRVFTGDPADPHTYAFLPGGRSLAAIIALRDGTQSEAVVAAIRAYNADAAILLYGANGSYSEEELVQSVTWPNALDESVERELELLATRWRVRALRDFVAQTEVVPVLLHPDPDPDALASAYALHALLRTRGDRMPILTLDEMTRPENRRMAELLNIQVTQVTIDELRAFDRLICVDGQPRMLVGGPMPKLAIIDHHPPEAGYTAEYFDIRPDVGATASILTEYLRAESELLPGPKLATGLLYGITTDTSALTRGVSPIDVEAYTFLLDRADQPLLRRIERPAYSAETARAYGRALAQLCTNHGIATVYLGELEADDSHILADIADFLLALNEANWAVAAAVVEDRLIVTLRHLGGKPGAGDLARRLTAVAGAGGGHDTMARAVLPLDGEWQLLRGADDDLGCRILLERAARHIDQLQKEEGATVAAPS